MTVWDDRLLEYAAENESVSAAAVKDLDVFRVSRSTISRRLKKLANHRLLLDLGNGVYVITDEGEAYLNEELDADKLEDHSENSNGETAQS
jgi:DeoR/GlpR family transcriptional regulator of sugar metabolism